MQPLSVTIYEQMTVSRTTPLHRWAPGVSKMPDGSLAGRCADHDDGFLNIERMGFHDQYGVVDALDLVSSDRIEVDCALAWLHQVFASGRRVNS